MLPIFFSSLLPVMSPGEMGEKGDLGPSGPPGDVGAMGDLGPAGPKGQMGERGKYHNSRTLAFAVHM